MYVCICQIQFENQLENLKKLDIEFVAMKEYTPCYKSSRKTLA